MNPYTSHKANYCAVINTAQPEEANAERTHLAKISEAEPKFFASMMQLLKKEGNL